MQAHMMNEREKSCFIAQRRRYALRLTTEAAELIEQFRCGRSPAGQSPDKAVTKAETIYRDKIAEIIMAVNGLNSSAAFVLCNRILQEPFRPACDEFLQQLMRKIVPPKVHLRPLAEKTEEGIKALYREGLNAENISDAEYVGKRLIATSLYRRYHKLDIQPFNTLLKFLNLAEANKEQMPSEVSTYYGSDLTKDYIKAASATCLKKQRLTLNPHEPGALETLDLIRNLHGYAESTYPYIQKTAIRRLKIVYQRLEREDPDNFKNHIEGHLARPSLPPKMEEMLKLFSRETAEP